MVNDTPILIRRMADYDRDIRLEVADVFVDGYYKDFSVFTKDREKLKKAFKDAFSAEIFYVAEIQGDIVGILACATSKCRGMHIEREAMKSQFGYFKGNLAFHFMKDVFNEILPYPDDTGYIECVATSEKARGRGVCTALVQYCMHSLPYTHLILEVLDSNLPAYRLYSKLGFSEIERKTERFTMCKGFKEKIYMGYSK